MKKIKQYLRNSLAVVMFLIALIGGFIPVLQGWVFFLAGYILLDFKKKDELETKILNKLHQWKVTRGIAAFWLKVKHKNTKLLENKAASVKEILKKTLDNEKKTDYKDHQH